MTTKKNVRVRESIWPKGKKGETGYQRRFDNEDDGRECFENRVNYYLAMGHKRTYANSWTTTVESKIDKVSIDLLVFDRPKTLWNLFGLI